MLCIERETANRTGPCRGTQGEKKKERERYRLYYLQHFLDMQNVAIDILLLLYYRYIIIVIVTLLLSLERDQILSTILLIAACHFRYPNQHSDYANITTSVTSD